MTSNRENIKASRDGIEYDVTVTWWSDPKDWPTMYVAVESAEFHRVEAHADDAFEALCSVRKILEPAGWRLGVAGAQPDVWPSGMCRDQGQGAVAYRMTPQQTTDTVPTFEPVDPATVVTVEEQRTRAYQLLDEIRRAAKHSKQHQDGP